MDGTLVGARKTDKVLILNLEVSNTLVTSTRGEMCGPRCV